MEQRKWCPIRDAICPQYCAWRDEDGSCLVARVMMAYSAKKLAPAIEENKDIPLFPFSSTSANAGDIFASIFSQSGDKSQ
jgi:hypothetical protein